MLSTIHLLPVIYYSSKSITEYPCSFRVTFGANVSIQDLLNYQWQKGFLIGIY